MNVQCTSTSAIAKANHAIHIADAATVIGVVGLAAAAAGVVVYVTAPKEFVVASACRGRVAGSRCSGTF